MRVHDDKSGGGGTLPAALVAVLVALIGLAGAVHIARTAAEVGPNVGDVIRFEPEVELPRDLHTQLSITRVSRRTCLFDLQTMHRYGGSLIIEEQRRNTPPQYRVHWAGLRSADGPDDCGRQADLWIDQGNLQMLAMAAGGWGVSQKHLAPRSLWVGGSTAVQ